MCVCVDGYVGNLKAWCHIPDSTNLIGHDSLKDKTVLEHHSAAQHELLALDHHDLGYPASLASQSRWSLTGCVGNVYSGERNKCISVCVT